MKTNRVKLEHKKGLKMNIKVLLVEDHELTRKGISFGLRLQSGIEVIGEVDNGKKAVEFVREQKPDIILMDVAMPVMNGITATQRINEFAPDIKIIMLTSISEKDSVLSAFSSGAYAYCLKDIKTEELVDVIKVVHNGGIWIAPAIASYVLEILQSRQNIGSSYSKSNNDFNLTAREQEILKLIAEGMSNKDIADTLILSLHTVKNHVKNIIQKLSVGDRTQAAIMALKENLV